MNKLPSTAIGGKTLLDIWLGRATQDYDLLQVFGCSAYFNAKDGKLNPREKKLVFLGVKRNMRCYKL